MFSSCHRVFLNLFGAFLCVCSANSFAAPPPNPSSRTSIYLPHSASENSPNLSARTLIGHPENGRNGKETYLIGLLILVTSASIRYMLNFETTTLDETKISVLSYKSKNILYFNLLMLAALLLYVYVIHERSPETLFKGSPADGFWQLWWIVFSWGFFYLLQYASVYIFVKKDDPTSPNSKNDTGSPSLANRFARIVRSPTWRRVLNMVCIRFQNILITTYILQFLDSLRLNRFFSKAWVRSISTASISVLIHLIFFLARGGAKKRSVWVTVGHRIVYNTFLLEASLRMNSIHLRLWNMLGLTLFEIFTMICLEPNSSFQRGYARMNQMRLEPIHTWKQLPNNKKEMAGMLPFLSIFLITLALDILQIYLTSRGFLGLFKVTQIKQKQYNDTLGERP